MSYSKDDERGIAALVEILKNAFSKMIAAATFDKTSIGSITSKDESGYTVSAFGSEYYIKSSALYKVGEIVAVVAPQNNFKKLYIRPYQVDTNSDAIKEINESLSDYEQVVTDVKDQLDGKTEQYFLNYVPDVNNYPANQWTDNNTKKEHNGDYFFNTATQVAYKWENVNNAWQWVELDKNQVPALVDALYKASLAQDTADGKRRTFITQPVPPYDIGDVWFTGEKIMVSSVNRKAGASYVASDWSERNEYSSASDTIAAMTHEQVFNKLTNNGAIKGVYEQSGNLYINADYIKTGSLSADLIKSGKVQSINGKTYFDLNSNNIVSQSGNFRVSIDEASLNLVGNVNVSGGNDWRNFASIYGYDNLGSGSDRDYVGIISLSSLSSYGGSIYTGDSHMMVKSDGILMTESSDSDEFVLFGVDSNGNVSAITVSAGSFNKSSSKRYKNNISELPEKYAKELLSFRPVQYYYNDKMGPSGLQYGMIAEEVSDIQEQGLTRNKDGEPEALDYSAFVPQLIKLCQMQQKQIDDLAERVSTLEKTLEETR